jgi:hypothetical protein
MLDRRDLIVEKEVLKSVHGRGARREEYERRGDEQQEAHASNA